MIDKSEIIAKIKSWVIEFPGMASTDNNVAIKYQPLYSSISTTALNGKEIFLMGINPGIEADYKIGLQDWNYHLESYRHGLFSEHSKYHSYLDYHPNGNIVRGFKNLLSEFVSQNTSLNTSTHDDWLRSIPVGNLFPRATHKASEISNYNTEISSIPLLKIITPRFTILMGSDKTRMIWLNRQGIAIDPHEYRLPFPDARGRGIIVRTAHTPWGGHLLAVPHPNALSGTSLQLDVGQWLSKNSNSI